MWLFKTNTDLFFLPFVCEQLSLSVINSIKFWPSTFLWSKFSWPFFQHLRKVCPFSFLHLFPVSVLFLFSFSTCFQLHPVSILSPFPPFFRFRPFSDSTLISFPSCFRFHPVSVSTLFPVSTNSVKSYQKYRSCKDLESSYCFKLLLILSLINIDIKIAITIVILVNCYDLPIVIVKFSFLH